MGLLISREALDLGVERTGVQKDAASAEGADASTARNRIIANRGALVKNAKSISGSAGSGALRNFP